MRSLAFATAAFIACAASGANAQVELKTYADANGYIDVQKLTCSQLAGTFQEDADLLTTWYSGSDGHQGDRPGVRQDAQGAWHRSRQMTQGRTGGSDRFRAALRLGRAMAYPGCACGLSFRRS
ncbi:hypothetical protein [Bosea sp. LC85]|uniref:hypothetical protein n=1 Tax=Bosea sp. LC85 TaxID=1502851 RepID=UPI001FCB5713|nr:hypothetical protein [Bosea sp. LC85]